MNSEAQVKLQPRIVNKAVQVRAQQGLLRHAASGARWVHQRASAVALPPTTTIRRAAAAQRNSFSLHLATNPAAKPSKGVLSHGSLPGSHDRISHNLSTSSRKRMCARASSR